MNKVELEVKVDSVTDEINFLKALYDAVSLLLISKLHDPLPSMPWGRRHSGSPVGVRLRFVLLTKWTLSHLFLNQS